MPPRTSSAATAAFSVRACACKSRDAVTTYSELSPSARNRINAAIRCSVLARPTPADGSAITVYELTCGTEPLP